MTARVKPGDLLWFDTRVGVELIGIVLVHHDELAVVTRDQAFYEFEKISGPGASIFWHTSNVHAYWDYKRIRASMKDGTLKVLARSK